MKIINTNHNINQEELILHNSSIFLAGPSPRERNAISWRTQALQILKELNYDGLVFVPEFSEDYEGEFDFMKQVEWEYFGLQNCALIVFWVPRCLQTLPGFTTNVEFGFYVNSQKNDILYGRPDDAPNTKYLDWLYEKVRMEKPFNTLENLLKWAVNVNLKQWQKSKGWRQIREHANY